MASSLTWGRRSRAPWRGLAALLLAACAALCPFMVEERASGQDALGAPTIGTVTITPVSLTVNWSAPAQTGGSAITAYDVRYILTSATDKADEHWTLARVTGGSTLQHALTGLRDSTSYDIQVRAVNADPAVGPWSTPAHIAVTSDHGDTIATATTVTLDSSVDGWIDAAGDDDLFQIALSNPVELWAYTRSGFDTAGHLLHDSGIQLTLDADSLYPFGEKNFALRQQLEEGTYYIRVRGNAGVSTGTYTLHIRAVQDPGSTASAATPIDLHGVQAGHAGSGSSADYFQLTVAADTWVKLQAIAAAPVSLTATVSNGEGTEIPAFILGRGYWEGNMVTHLAFELVAFLPAGTYVIQVTNEAGATGGRYVLHVGVSEDDQRLHDRCSAFATSLGDPLSGCQWHLSNTGAVRAGGARQDINVANAWLTTKGEGVTVAVVDGGLDSGHADLRDNVLVARNHNYLGTGDIRNLTNDHGTKVAGLIAARDNGVGMVGVAPRATIYAYNLAALFEKEGFNQAKAADAATRHVAETAVSNNSWGELSDRLPKFAGAVWEQAIERGLTEGFGGKGTTYVWAGGNGGDADYSNLDERLSHYGVIAACSVNYNDVRATLSEKGSNLWVCAPSNDGALSLPQIATTSSRGGYTDTFGGTSAAAAIVSGVAALVRAANLDLTWRDVKLILAASARKNDAGNPGWQVGATKYRSDTDTEHYWFNHQYGFGTVDAGAAVALAGSWTNVPAQPALPALRTMTLTSADTDLNLPDLGTVTTSVTAESDYVEFVEFIAVKIDIDHDGFRDLRIELTSPSAAVSVLTTETFFANPLGPSRALRRSLRLGSARHLGEHPAGTWSMSIRDHYAPGDGTLKSWSMTVYGHGFSPGYPTITEALRTGTFLTVHWAAPSDAGASAISAYDLRYIRSDATDKSNSAWSSQTGISSSGALRHELTGLTEDVEYDLQVRAINSDGTGPWSEVFSGSTVAAVPGAPAITTVTPGRERLTVSWSAPAEDGGVAITGYNLRHIPNAASAAEKAVDDNWILQSPAWTEGSGDLEAAIGGLIGGVGYDVQVHATNRAGSGDWSTPATGAPGSNSAPQFAHTRAQLTVPENSPAQTRVGDPLQATDADGDSLMYTLTGSDLFEIDVAQGQITVAEGAVLNHEVAPSHSVMVTVSDPRDATDTDALTILVSDVNEAPAFAAATAERSVSANAQPGAKVGVPVIATDVDDDLLGYRLQGAPEFEIDEQTGQITVAEGAAPDAARSPYSVTVIARDPEGDEATVEVTITVTAGPPIIIITGGGGGGGGGGGPSPSEVDFEWNVKRDIEELDGGNDWPTGLWSDGETLWIAENGEGADDEVYAYDRASGERVEEREFDLAEANRAPRGFWSDGETVWVSDSGQERLFAYRLADGERLEEREFALAERNADARGNWSDHETMWVLDGRADALFVYDFESGELLAEYALDSANSDPHGIWSDGVTVWVSDHGAKRLFAYRLEGEELTRNRDEEFGELSPASNNSPRGIWSDGDVMYVADESDDRVYSYNMPDAIDARLASLTLSGVDIGEFDPGRTEYEAVVADGVTETTVEAEAIQRRTDVTIHPPDADGDDANGHQVALQDRDEITVTVTSQDGSRSKTYRVRFPETGWDPARDPWPHCLRGAVSEGFSLVVYEGGSVEELVSCAESRGIVAFYALHDGAYVSYILGAPGFVNAGFLELFPDGLPPIAPLVAGSNGPPSPDPFGDDPGDGGQQPWPECLRGDIAAGFSLVVYEGGSVGELEACARSLDVTALYTLSEGEFVSYILGAPAFVNRPFRDLFADGLPLMTPLVARSEGPSGGRSDRDDAVGNFGLE